MSDDAENKPRQVIDLDGGNVMVEGMEYRYEDGDAQIYESGALSDREVFLAGDLVRAMKPATGVSEIRIHLKDRRPVNEEDIRTRKRMLKTAQSEKEENILASILAGLVLVQEVETEKLILNWYQAQRHREILTDGEMIGSPMTTGEIQHLIDDLNTGKKAIVDVIDRRGA